MNIAFSGDYTHEELEDLIVRNSGLSSHLGTADVQEIMKRIEEDNDEYAKLVLDAMIYQFAKAVGRMRMRAQR